MEKYYLAYAEQAFKVKKGETPKINHNIFLEYERIEEFENLEQANAEVLKRFSRIGECYDASGKYYLQRIYASLQVVLKENKDGEMEEVDEIVWETSLCPDEVYYLLKDADYYTEEEVIKVIDYYVGSGYQNIENAREIILKELRERAEVFMVNGKNYYTVKANSYSEIECFKEEILGKEKSKEMEDDWEMEL